MRRFWDAPNLVEGEGHKAVQMFEAVAAGDIKLLWVMGTNPAVSLPRADHVREALGRLELLVVSENVASNDTANLAHVRLPAAAWGEKDGTVTNSERRISRQRAFLRSARRGAARLVDPVAGRGTAWLGGSLLLSVAGRHLSRACAPVRLRERRRAAVRRVRSCRAERCRNTPRLVPVQWPVRREGEDSERLFGDGKFLDADRPGTLRRHQERADRGRDVRRPGRSC